MIKNSLFALFLLISFNSFAGISGSLKGAYEYGLDVNDGSTGTAKATNVGYSAEGTLAYVFSVASPRIHLGGFYFYDSSKTYKVDSASATVQNFSISPTGYGGELMLGFGKFFLRGGYGLYKADARKVENSVGRDYSLTDGTGFHGGIKYVIGSFGRLGFFADATYRKITYGKINIKSSDDAPTTLETSGKWSQTMASVGLGMMIVF